MWLSFMIYGIERKVIKDKYTYIAETRLAQHFFFFRKRKPVLKEKPFLLIKIIFGIFS